MTSLLFADKNELREEYSHLSPMACVNSFALKPEQLYTYLFFAYAMNRYPLMVPVRHVLSRRFRFIHWRNGLKQEIGTVISRVKAISFVVWSCQKINLYSLQTLGVQKKAIGDH